MPEDDAMDARGHRAPRGAGYRVLAVLASGVQVSTLRSMDLGSSGEGLSASGTR
jgi:hypothetical protein